MRERKSTTVEQVTISSNDQVLSFAGEEWSRLRGASGAAGANSSGEVWIGTWEQLKASQSEFLDRHQCGQWQDKGFSDEFIIIETEGKIVLSGKSERSTLYAVYQYAQEAWGMQWVYPETVVVEADRGALERQPVSDGSYLAEERKQVGAHKQAEAGKQAGEHEQVGEHKQAGVRDQTGELVRAYAPRMERRGFVFETINEPDYLAAMLDWFGKNKINEIFFTFFLWDQVGEAIAPEIAKRGIKVTLGGHSMKFFLNKGVDMLSNTADHPYTAKTQLDFRDGSWQGPMIKAITDYCANVPNLARVSMWPEDIAVQSSDGFLDNYLLFSENLNTSLAEAGLQVEVEHIAYNAGLAWDMLELNGNKPSSKVDTLLAFWGRDYRYGYEDSPHESDSRAKAAIEDWAKELGLSSSRLTIFEYYSDHFMFTNLFPFLSHRIMDDIAYYEKLNVLGMVDLVVPYRGPDSYPWKWVHNFNSYVFCRALWSDDLKQIRNDFYSFYPESERAAVRALFETIESKLAAITSWNIPLFPARAVDPEKAQATEDQKLRVLADLEDMISSVGKVLEQSQLKPDCEPYRHAQYIMEYAGRIRDGWLSR